MPIRITPFSAASSRIRRTDDDVVTSVVTALPALKPTATLRTPVVTPYSAAAPLAVLRYPFGWTQRIKSARRVADTGGVAISAFSPLAVLLLPVVLLYSAIEAGRGIRIACVAVVSSALYPTAVLFAPVVLQRSAPYPVAVLKLAVFRKVRTPLSRCCNCRRSSSTGRNSHVRCYSLPLELLCREKCSPTAVFQSRQNSGTGLCSQ